MTTVRSGKEKKQQYQSSENQDQNERTFVKVSTEIQKRLGKSIHTGTKLGKHL